eukprot:3037075-Alexandrium_andersonii.AAC.1
MCIRDSLPKLARFRDASGFARNCPKVPGSACPKLPETALSTFRQFRNCRRQHQTLVAAPLGPSEN